MLRLQDCRVCRKAKAIADHNAKALQDAEQALGELDAIMDEMGADGASSQQAALG